MATSGIIEQDIIERLLSIKTSTMCFSFIFSICFLKPQILECSYIVSKINTKTSYCTVLCLSLWSYPIGRRQKCEREIENKITWSNSTLLCFSNTDGVIVFLARTPLLISASNWWQIYSDWRVSSEVVPGAEQEWYTVQNIIRLKDVLRAQTYIRVVKSVNETTQRFSDYKWLHGL